MSLFTKIVEQIEAVAPAAWDALVHPASAPMLEHGYLAALERSSTLALGGMQPRHITVWEGERLVAAAPCYLKQTDRGDPLPDWAARVALKNELPYFPTVFVGIPFASAGGPKLLLDPGGDRSVLAAHLVDGIQSLARTLPMPVAHFYLSTQDEVQLLAAGGFHPRISPEYAWVNEGYRSFDEFLARLHSKRRSGIRVERRRIAETNVRMRTVRGRELTPELMDLMWRYHSHTISKHGDDFDFFNRDFFLALPELLSDHTELFVAERDGAPIAASLYITSATAFYSRTCGSLEDEPLVHFEATWYYPMDEAIRRGVTFIDPGGPGKHKLIRGFAPIGFHHSATWVGDPDLDEVTATLIAKERAWMPEHLAEQRSHSALR